MEEARCYHLDAYEREGEHVYLYGSDGYADECGIGGEEACALVREQVDEDKAERGDAESCAQSVLEQAEQTVVSACTVVVSRDGEHSLIDAHVYHDEYESHLVGDAVSAHCHVAAVLLQSGVDEYYDDAGAHVHGERRHANGEDVLYDL